MVIVPNQEMPDWLLVEMILIETSVGTLSREWFNSLRFHGFINRFATGIIVVPFGFRDRDLSLLVSAETLGDMMSRNVADAYRPEGVPCAT